MAWLLERDIYCHKSDVTIKICASPTPVEGSHRADSICSCIKTPIHISNIGNTHFQSVVRIQNTDSRELAGSSKRKSYKGSYCGDLFEKPQYLEQHRKKDHRRSHPCDECEETFDTVELMIAHVKQIHMSSQERSCPICSEKLDDEASESRHMLIVHKRRVESTNATHSQRSSKGKVIILNCPLCKYSTPKKSNLDRHLELKTF